MVLIGNFMSALTDFLYEAKNLGIIQDYTLVPCDKVKENVLPKTDELISKLLDKLREASLPVEDNGCLKKDLMEGSEDDKVLTEDPDPSDRSPESSNSSVTDFIEVIDEEQKTETSSSDSPSKESIIQMQDDINKVSEIDEPSIDKSKIQIQVDTPEMKRRIAAFISRKRKEVDEWNVQEFCGRSYLDEQETDWEQSYSCARVDAVFVPRRGSKSHIKVSKVKNVWGPQTKKIKQEGVTEDQAVDASLQAIEERLDNMESHLKLKHDNSFRLSIFQRLKALEDRILFLESTSPEYIHLPNFDYPSPTKGHTTDKEKMYLNCDAEELKRRIQSLKESFKEKSPQIKTELPF